MRIIAPFAASILIATVGLAMHTLLGRVCSASDMEDYGASCDDPKICTNACANKYESGTECRQCCVLFTNQNDRNACLSDCETVWPQSPAWPEFP